MSSKRTRKKTSTLYTILVLLVGLIGYLYAEGVFDKYLPQEEKEPAALEQSTDPQRHIQTAQTALEALPQQERCSRNGDPTAGCEVPKYSREEQFGKAWVDVDQDGCRTREQVLARDMNDVTQESDCYVSSGVLEDPYTGKTLTDRSAVDIDHVIPLALAWDLGAADWDQGTRVAFANDPAVNLLAVDGKTNQVDKKDKTLSEWEPETDYACTYAIKYVWALSQYDLPVTPDDYTAAQNHLNSCDVVYGEPTDAAALDDSVREYANKF